MSIASPIALPQLRAAVSAESLARAAWLQAAHSDQTATNSYQKEQCRLRSIVHVAAGHAACEKGAHEYGQCTSNKAPRSVSRSCGMSAACH